MDSAPSIDALIRAADAADEAFEEDVPATEAAMTAAHQAVRDCPIGSAIDLLMKFRHQAGTDADLVGSRAAVWIERDLLALAETEMLQELANLHENGAAAGRAALEAGMDPADLVGVHIWTRDADPATYPRLQFRVLDVTPEAAFEWYSPKGRVE